MSRGAGEVKYIIRIKKHPNATETHVRMAMMG